MSFRLLGNGALIIDHLLSRMTVLGIELAPEEIREHQTAIPFDVGFPRKLPLRGHAGVNYSTELTAVDVYWTTTWIDVRPHQRPNEPRSQWPIL